MTTTETPKRGTNMINGKIEWKEPGENCAYELASDGIITRDGCVLYKIKIFDNDEGEFVTQKDAIKDPEYFEFYHTITSPQKDLSTEKTWYFIGWEDQDHALYGSKSTQDTIKNKN